MKFEEKNTGSLAILPLLLLYCVGSPTPGSSGGVICWPRSRSHVPHGGARLSDDDPRVLTGGEGMLAFTFAAFQFFGSVH